MKFQYFSINGTKHDVTFATKEGGSTTSFPMATPLNMPIAVVTHIFVTTKIQIRLT